MQTTKRWCVFSGNRPPSNLPLPAFLPSSSQPQSFACFRPPLPVPHMLPVQIECPMRLLWTAAGALRSDGDVRLARGSAPLPGLLPEYNLFNRET